MIATALLGFNNDPTIKNFESINAALIKIYKLDEKDSKEEERQRRYERQLEKKKVQREKRQGADNPLAALVKDKKKKGKLGEKVKKMFGMLKDGLGGMLTSIGPLLTSLGAILTSAIFLKIVAILAIGAIIITYIKSEKFRDWVNKHVLDPVAKVFTEELPKALAKVLGFGGSDPAPTTDTPSSDSPEQTATPPTGGVEVLIPLDHVTSNLAGKFPDDDAGTSFEQSTYTGADGRERQHQDNAAKKLKASLAKKGINAKIIKPEDYKSYESYDRYLKGESEKGTRIVPLHFDAAISGGGIGFLTRTKAGDKGDAAFAAPIQEALADFQKDNTNLGNIRSDTKSNPTVNVGAASPTALVELGVMVDWEKHYGTNFTESPKFQVLIDSVADGIEKGGNFEKKQKGGTIGSSMRTTSSIIPNQSSGTAKRDRTPYIPRSSSSRKKSSPVSRRPTPVHRMSGGNVMGKGYSPKQKQQGRFKMPKLGLPKFGGFKMPSFGAMKSGGTASSTPSHTPSSMSPQMTTQLPGVINLSQVMNYSGGSSGTSVSQQKTPRPKLNKGGMVRTTNQSTTRLSEASNNSMMGKKRTRTIIVVPSAPAALPPLPAPSGGGGMMIQSSTSRLQMKSQMNRINKGAVA